MASNQTTAKVDRRKENGIHYTPPKLAQFLANQISLAANKLYRHNRAITIVDPACGDGQLLTAMLSVVAKHIRSPIRVVGFDTDGAAIDSAKQRVESWVSSSSLGKQSIEPVDADLRQDDFLGHVLDCNDNFGADIVISNPPYVRTQILGQNRSVELAKAFGLTGRVDLYHAFNSAITHVLNPGGILGLLTPNRFMSVQSGRAMRELLLNHYELRAIFDLGDTQLFTAAVLPMVLVGEKRESLSGDWQTENCRFVRIYQQHQDSPSIAKDSEESARHILDVLDRQNPEAQTIDFNGQSYLIERGHLAAPKHEREPWRLVTESSQQFVRSIRSHRYLTFDDVAEIKVGIKTTADKILICNDGAPLEIEDELLHPLITHFDATRWQIDKIAKKVLYPYQMNCRTRKTIDLKDFPRASVYLNSHRERLAGRRYLIDSGRDWFEIWVPQKPDLWKEPKIVWPDISENPRFFLDHSGAIVNGDCYWLRLKPDHDPSWLYLILGVANSSLTNQFYDTYFHNKLYAGRRRFMTQYVRRFPLPDLQSTKGLEIVNRVKDILKTKSRRERAQLEIQINRLVWQSFGFER